MTKTVSYSHIENWYPSFYYRKGPNEFATYNTIIEQTAYEMHVFEDI